MATKQYQYYVNWNQFSAPFVVNTNGFDDFYASVDEARGIMRPWFHEENMRINYAHDLRKRTGNRSEKIDVNIFDLGGKVKDTREVTGPIAKLALDLMSRGIKDPLIDVEILCADPESLTGWDDLQRRVKTHLEKQHEGYKLIPVNPSSDGRGATVNGQNTYVLSYRMVKGTKVMADLMAKYWAYSMFYMSRGDESHGYNLGKHRIAVIKGLKSDDGNIWLNREKFLWVTRLEKVFAYANPDSYAETVLSDPDRVPASLNSAAWYVNERKFRDMCRANGVNPDEVDGLAPEKSVKFWDGTPVIEFEFHTMQLGASKTRCTLSASQLRMLYAMSPYGVKFMIEGVGNAMWRVEDALNRTIIGENEPLLGVMRLTLETAKDTDDEEYDKGIDAMSLLHRRFMTGLPVSASELLQLKPQLYLYNVKRRRVKGITAPIFNEDSLKQHEIGINYFTAVALKYDSGTEGMLWRMPCMLKEISHSKVKLIHFLECILINGEYAADWFNGDFDWDKMSFTETEEPVIVNDRVIKMAAKSKKSVEHDMLGAMAASKMGKSLIGIYNSAIDAVMQQTTNLEIINRFVDNAQALIDTLKKDAVCTHPKYLAAEWDLSLSLSNTRKILLGRVNASQFEHLGFSSKKVTPMEWMMTACNSVLDKNLNTHWESLLQEYMCVQVPMKNSAYVAMSRSEDPEVQTFVSGWEMILKGAGLESCIATGDKDNRLWDDNHFPMETIERSYESLKARYCRLIANKDAVFLARRLSATYVKWTAACTDPNEADPYRYIREERTYLRELNRTNPELVGYALQYLFTVVAMRSHYKLVPELDRAEPGIRTRSTAVLAAFMIKAGSAGTDSYFNLSDEVKGLNYIWKTDMRAFKVKDLVKSIMG